MIELDNQTNLVINLEILESIANSLSQKMIELIITDEKTIQEINHEYRNKNKSTDVLSFPIHDESNILPLGSIIICEYFVIKNAKKFHHSIEEECTLLFIHGLLHLLGFDHETDDGQMREEEKRIIQAFSLAKSLIIRTEEN